MVEGDGFAAILKRQGVGGGVLEVPIRVVFDDEDVVVLADGVDLFAAGEREEAGGRVLAHAGNKLVKATGYSIGGLTSRCTSGEVSCPCTCPISRGRLPDHPCLRPACLHHRS